ncbi:transforming acidic coiled-coil-containing protein 3-like [Leguminivora glycinivorella]|uniref:transforming acidic coiled-coil-containing protein 3-like n=1 Tax=Leguminivora glycinivorella TaxID=1035111 RepID=UPI00200D811A|nr:transforming acidic coiled-coil-containing protein 3-like [Leguminivora glycinivorella]XP_047994718.1 transforming acidic coiled-coil-containing protein 3-like [Leguminivora glycinivorella]
MFSNIVTVDPSPTCNKNRSLSNIYQKFQSLLGRGADIDIGSCGKEDMLSSRGSTVASEDSFITPVSSVGDLMAMSPRGKQVQESADVTSDLLTGADFDSVCDITMQEVQHYEDPMYIDPTSMDYLVKCAESTRSNNHVDRGKESLFIKFDPLYARQKLPATPTESLPDSTEADIGYETGSAASIFADSSVATPKHSMSVGSISCAWEKPTQVVPPVKNDLPKTEAKTTPQLVRSASAILSSSHVATDRLLNFIGSTPPVAAPRSPHHRSNSHQASHHVDRLHSLRIILQKQEHEALLLRQENGDLKSALHNIESRYASTVEELELKVKKLTDEKHNLIERENQLLQQLHDKNLNNKQMGIVMEEYEKTISSLIGEHQREQLLSQEMQQKLSAERDQALSHLASMESSFNDLLSKYEKCKSIIMDHKETEKIFEQKITEYEAGLKKYEELYTNLKQVTADSLAKANETLETVKKNHSVELTKLNATIKKHEIKISSLEESLTQKTRDNEELTRICDQLINEVH